MVDLVDPGFRFGLNPTVLALAAGTALLLFGRRLYFLLLAVAGFAVGFFLAQQLGIDVQPNAQWLIGALFAVGLALLAKVLHRIVLGVVGFLLGALATTWALELWLENAGPVGWVVVLVGGIVAAFIMPTLFEAGLILLSSVVGARLLVEGLGDVGLPGAWVPWTFLGLVLLGLLVQWRSGDEGSGRSRRKRRRRRRQRDDYDD